MKLGIFGLQDYIVNYLLIFGEKLQLTGVVMTPYKIKMPKTAIKIGMENVGKERQIIGNNDVWAAMSCITCCCRL